MKELPESRRANPTIIPAGISASPNATPVDREPTGKYGEHGLMHRLYLPLLQDVAREQRHDEQHYEDE